MLTLYTTPVVYLYMDRFSLWWARRHPGRRGGEARGRYPVRCSRVGD